MSNKTARIVCEILAVMGAWLASDQDYVVAFTVLSFIALPHLFEVIPDTEND